MKKRLIALAVASAFVAPVAMADSNVNVYGTVDMSIGSSNNGVVSATQVASNTTKIGFKGNEDLGDGLAAVWQIEQQIDLANTGANGGAAKTTFASRNSFLGLKGDSWGTVLLGIHDTPYKISTRHMDPFGDGIGDNRALMGKAPIGQDARLKDVVAYMSPSMNGFSVAAAYATGGASANNAVAGATKGDAISLAAMYDVDALKVHFGYQTVKNGTAAGQFSLAGSAGDKIDAWKLGVGYTFDALTVAGIYESVKTSGATASYINNAGGAKHYTLNGVYKFNSDAIKLAYVKSGNVGSVAATGAKQFSLGYDHNMSKRTKLYAVYTKVSNDTAASFGLADTSTGNPTAAAAVGKNVSAFGIGLKHSF
ncbi:MAG: porin [Sideroxydans sp.]|nr:porin [Sideroxydans sp.]